MNENPRNKYISGYLITWKRNEMKYRRKKKSFGYLINVEKKWVTEVVVQYSLFATCVF